MFPKPPNREPGGAADLRPGGLIELRGIPNQIKDRYTKNWASIDRYRVAMDTVGDGRGYLDEWGREMRRSCKA